jgi:hypothetical protein
MNLPSLCLYFAVGLVRDALGTAWTRCVAQERAFWAAGLGAVLTWFDIAILAVIVIGREWAAGIAYGLGCGIGCMAIMLIKRRR